MVSDSNGPEGLTVDSPNVLSVFEAEISDEEQISSPAETPAAEAPAAEAEAEPSSEPGEAEEAESPEQVEEQPAESDEQPAAGLDPSLKLKVKVDGKEEEVTLDELTKGYSRTADYTRKTQELAGHRKALETETQAARAERQQLAQNLRLLEQAVAEITPKEPDWERLRTEHPEKFQAMWIEWNQGEKDRSELRTQREAAKKKVAEDNARALEDHVKAEAEKLKVAIPEWSKDDVRKTDKAAMQAYAEKLGFTPQDLANVSDHRVLILLREAALYRKAQEKKPALLQRVETLKTTKPGGESVSRKPQTDLQKALSRLAKTGSRDDADSVFLHALDD
jgi:hypothetical protein